MKRRALYLFLPFRFALLVTPLLAAWPAKLQAQTFTGGGGAFSNPVQWNFGNGPVPSSNLAGSLNFLSYGSSAPTINTDYNLTLQTLQLSNFSNAATGLTIASQIAGNFAFAGAGGIQILSTGTTGLSAPVTIGSGASGLTISGSGLGNLTSTGIISSNNVTTAPLTIATAGLPNFGVVALNGANTFTSSGGVVLSGGNLFLGNNSSLGIFGNALNSLTVNGGSLQGTGTIMNPVVLNSGLTLTGVSNVLTFGAAGGLGLGGLSGAGGLTIQPGGTAQTQIFNVANSYSGATNIGQISYGTTLTSDNPGGMRVNSAAGSVLNTSAINIRDGGVFEINKANGDSANNARVNASTPISVTGGFVQVIGNPGLVTQNLGTLTGSSLTTILAGTSIGASTSLNLANLVRSGAGTFAFAGTNLGNAAAAVGVNNANIVLTQINGAAPAAVLVGGAAGTPAAAIIPWAVGDTANGGSNFAAGSGFVTYGANGVRLLNTGTEYNTIAGGALVAGSNNRLVASAAQNTNITINSLFNETTGITLSGTGIVDITSGALASNVGAFTVTNPVTFGGGTGEGIVSVVGGLGSANTITASGALTGSTLTKSGEGILILGSTANAFSSNRITVNAGVLQIAGLNNLGIANAGTSGLELHGQAFSALKAGLLYTGAGTETMNIPITLGSGHSQVRLTGGGNLTLAGLISGSGGLNIDPGATASSVVTLANGANSFTGGLRLGSSTVSTLQFASDGALGAASSPITINATGMTVKLQGNWTTGRNIALEGALGGVTATTLGFDTAGFNSTWSGPIVGGGTIIRGDTTGTPGVWTITGANNPYTGTITLGTTAAAGGKLALSGAGELSSASLSLANANSSFDISTASGRRQIASLSGIAGTSVILGGNDLISGGNGTTYAGTISGTGKFIKAGGGTLTLSGTNTYSGGTDVWAGGISINNDANLGAATGTLALRGGNLTLNTNSVTLGAARPVIFDATPSTLVGAAPANSINTGAFDLTIPGSVTGAGGYEKTGTGNLIFTGTNTSGSSVANPSSGFIKVNQGAIVFNSDSNLGQVASGSFPGTKIVLLSLGADTVGGTLRLNAGQGAVTINRYIAMQNANSNRASIDVGAGSALTYSGTLVGAVAGTAQQITKTGTGTMTFDANAALFPGNFAIGNGTAATGNVSLTANANLSRTGVIVAAASGATLDVSGLTKDFGNLTLAAGTTLQLGTGGSLTTGWNNAGPTIDGVITSTGASSFNQMGTGSHTYTAAETFTGSFTNMFVGNTVLSGNGAFGALTNMTIGNVGSSINRGPTLSLDNGATNLNTRLAATQNVYMNNSNLSLTGNAVVVTNQVASSYNAAGSTIITMAAGGGTLNFQNAVTGYTRVDRGTTLVRANVNTLGTGAATSTLPNLLFGNLNAGSLVGQAGGVGVQTPILPYMVAHDGADAAGAGNTFATIGANGITPLSTSTGYSPTFVGATTNVLSAASTTFSGSNGQANALLIGGTANTVRLDSAAAEVLVVNAGAIANTVTQVYGVNAAGNTGTLMGIQTPELQTGSANTRELIVHNLNADLAIGAKITTSGGLTKSGGYTATGSTLYLTNAGNSYTGGTVVDGGTLAIDTLSAINPSVSNSLTLSGGYLKYRGPSTTFTAGVPIKLGGGSATNAGASGGVNIVSGTTLTVPAGAMTGFGGVAKDGTGVLYAQGVQNFSGPVNIQSGAYAVDNAGGFGTNSTVVFDSNAGSAVGGTVQFRANNLTINKNFNIISSNAASGAGFDTMGNNVTLTGVISSPINNSKGLFKVGDGDLTLTGASNYTGSTQVYSGNLIFAGANGSALFSGGNTSASAFINTNTFVTLGNGAIVLDNRNASGGNNNNRLPDPFTTVQAGGDSLTQSGIRLFSGGFTLRGNETVATTETTNRMEFFFGTVTLENNGQNVTLNTGRVNRISNVSAGLIRGTNLGATPGSTSTNWFAVDEGAQSSQMAGAGGAMGTPFISIVPGFMADSSATGVGTDLVTYDSGVGFRKLTASEYTSSFAGTISAPNFDVSRAPNIALGSGTTTAPAFTNWATAVKLGSGAVLNGTGTLNLTQSTIMATGNATVNLSNIQSVSNGGYDILTPGAGTNLTINSAMNGATLVKYGEGKLTFGGAYYGSGNFLTGQGNITLSGANAYVNPVVLLGVVRGATFDLGGADRLLPAPTFLSGVGANGLDVVQDGTISLGANNYSINGTASTLYTGAMTGTGGFRKLAFSTGSTSFSQDIAYTGTTYIGAGVFALPMNGRLTGTSLIDIHGGALTLNNGDDSGFPGGYVAQRIPVSTPINLAGTITVTGNANTPGVHQFGSTALVGNGTITPTPGANAPITLTFADISRNANKGTLVLGGTNLGLAQAPNGGSRVFATNINGGAPAAALIGGGGADGTTTMSIVPWAWSSTAGSLVTYGANGFRPLSTVAGVETEANLDAPSGVNANIRATGAAVLTAAREVNSLTTTNGGVAGAFDLTLRSGALASTAAGTIGVNTNSLRTGAGGANNAELVIFNTALTTLAYNIGTTGGVTKYGAGTLALTGTNTFTGGLSVQNGLVAFSNDNQLGAAGGTIRFGGNFGTASSGLQYAGPAGAPVVTSRPLINNSEALLAATGINNQIWSLTGGISGPGSLHYNGTSTAGFVFEPGINTYTGGTQIFEGIVAIRGDGVNADSAFGNGGQLDIDGTAPGGIVQLANWTTSRPISISFTSHLNTNGYNTTWNGSVQGGSVLTKTGLGMLTMTNPNPYTAAMSLNAGEVRLRDRGAVNAGFTLGFGTQVILDDTGTHFADRVPDGSAITNNNGDLRLLGSSSNLTEEVIGSLTLGSAAKVSVVPGAGQAAVLRLGSGATLTRSAASSILFRGTNLGVNAPGTANSANIMVFNPLGSAAALTGGGAAPGNSAISIIAGAYGDTSASGNGTQMVTYDLNRGIRLLDTSEFSNNLNNGTVTNDNIHLTGTSTNIANATTVNALWLENGATVNTTAAAGVLTVSAGNILSTGNNNVISGAAGGISVGANAIAVGGPGNLTISSALPNTNTGGLVKTGNGTLTLTNANAYTGTTTVASGTVVVGNNGAFGAGTVRFLGGTLQGDGTPRTLTNAVGLSGNVTIGGSSDVTLNGTVALESATRTINVTNTGVTTINGVIGQNNQQATGLVKEGPGRLVLTAANTYGTSAAGNGSFYASITTINGGELRANNTTGSATGGSTVDVNSGGTLGGTGFIVPAQTLESRNTVSIHSGGTLAPGNSPGILTIGSGATVGITTATLLMDSGSAFKFQYTGTPATTTVDTGSSLTPGATGNSKVTVNGSVDIDNGAIMTLTGTFSDYLPGQTYSFLVGTGTGTVDSFNITNPSQFDTTGFTGYTPGVFAMQWHNVGTNIFLNFTPVPEPGSFALLAGAGAGALLLRRRRR